MAGTDVFLGLDLGSRTTKLVEMAGGAVRRSEVFDTSPDTLDRVRARLAARGYIRAAATGYGRFLVNAHLDCRVVTEITACAQGARFLRPAAGLVIDVGGQDSKVILLGGGPGPFADFEMNDRCAAGTGRFLEVMAARLGLPLGEFGREAGPDDGGPLALSSMCTVFAESEVISATARGADRAELARGLHEAVVRRAVAMLRRLPLEDEIVFCGGGALNACLRELISEALGREVHAPPAPQIVAALGAALSVEG